MVTACVCTAFHPSPHGTTSTHTDYKLLCGRGKIHFLCPCNETLQDCYRWLQINQLALIYPNVTLTYKNMVTRGQVAIRSEFLYMLCSNYITKNFTAYMVEYQET